MLPVSEGQAGVHRLGAGCRDSAVSCGMQPLTRAQG